MKIKMKYFKTDQYLIFGLLLIIISTALFLIEPESFKESSNLFSFLFFIHYCIPVVYFFVLRSVLSTGFLSLFGPKIYSGHIVLLVLFNISAFSLNRELVVFYESATWLTVLIAFENSLLLLIAFLKETPRALRTILIVASPLFILFHLHQIFILLPISLFGFIGGLFLGIGLLLFVPFFYVIALIRTYKNLAFSVSDLKISAITTLLMAVGVGYQMLIWNNVDEKIQNGYLDADAPLIKPELPTWVTVSKNIQSDYITEAYLKSDLVYQHYDNFWGSRSGFLRFDEQKIHDPLIALCMGIQGKSSMDQQSRIKVLNFLYNKRHQTADRFWRGDHLTTDQVVTNVQIFPSERLTYSEMILTIANNDRRKRWRNQEEAVYTFQLPEGGVITSLSLWINGIEEKGILTTKSKAENAYNSIVGRERRDPSVIYWMEGNKARIRVFPCTPTEDRKFKVGVTAPLNLRSGILVYQPITFEGPDFSSARSSINIVTNGVPINTDLSFHERQGYLSWKGSYEPTWAFNIALQPISKRSFRFIDEVFISRETKQSLMSFEPKKVYLDITNNWTIAELDQIKKLFATKQLIVLDGPSNPTAPTDYSNFTLFPYHKITNPDESIVITKGGMATPNFEDLKDSDFKKAVFQYFNRSRTPILVLDIAASPSDYHRSLREFGVISHHNIDLDALEQFVLNKQYPDPRSNANVVDLAGNGISIEKATDTTTPRGSDHLMRLFYYQSILDEIGNTYFSSDQQSFIEEHLATSASMANVVTPLSSLIVLETQEDYDRFEIERNKDSLGNASIKNQGAAPEPHEWALIVFGISIMAFLYFKKG